MMRPNLFPSRRQRGFTLLEIIAVLAIAAVILGGAILLSNTANSSQKTKDALSELGTITQAVQGYGQPDYSFLATNGAITIAGSNQIPSKWVTGTVAVPTGLTNPYRGAVTIAPAAGPSAIANSVFVVTYTGLTQDACVKMVTQDLGTSMVSVTAGTTTATSAPLTPAQAKTGCATAPTTASWTFY